MSGTNLAQEFGISKQQISDIGNMYSNLHHEEMPNARDVEDWLNLENELPTSPQMSVEEILATVVWDSTESKSVCSDEEDEGDDAKLVSTKEQRNVSKNACRGWNHRLCRFHN